MLKGHEIALGFLFAIALGLMFFAFQQNISMPTSDNISDSTIDIAGAVAVIALIYIARKGALHFARKDEKEENKKWNAGPYNQSTEPPIDNSAFVNEARAYRETQKSSERKRDSAETATILVLGFAGIIAFLQYRTLDKTDQTLKAEQRARVTPLAARLARAPVQDGGISYYIDVVNSGREPAVGLNWYLKNAQQEAPKTGDVNLVDVAVPENISCDGLEPVKGRSLIPPTGTQTFSISYGSKVGIPKMVADEKIMGGNDLYIVNGCMVYVGGGKRRYSSFCFIMHSVAPRVLTNVPNTVVAANGRQFFFVVCRSGFDAN
jgi:hypothetical protein